MKTCDLLVKCLENEGVEYVFGIPGEETLDIMDSLGRSNISFVLARHEQAAAFMADAYGRLTGKPGVCLSTLGPGATNLLTGIADAFLDRAPLVAITGQADQGRIHKESHQYIDIVKNFATVTKWNTRIELPEVVAEVVRKAFKIAAMEKPGPVHLELSEDIAIQKVEKIYQTTIPPITPRRSSPDRQSLRQASELIENSVQPVILAGNGVVRKNVAARLTEFAETFGIPVLTTFMGKGAVSAASECYVGTMGLGQDRHITDLFSKTDLVVAVGYDPVEYSPCKWNPGVDKKIVHIDYTTSEVDVHYVPEVEIISDVKETLELLEGMTSCNKKDPYVSHLRQELLETFEQGGSLDSWPLKPQRVLHALRKALAAEDIAISDVGTHKMWMAKFYPVYAANTLLMSNGFASMGFALPAAIAAKLVHPDRKVAAVCGDGGFLMNVQEMETACRLGLDIVIIVFNDGGYDLIKWKGAEKFGTTWGLDFTNPDFVKLAESFGAQGFSVRDSANLDSVLREAFSLRGPVIVDVPIDYSDKASLTKLL
jgi:acetolactate synthase-1/2/3 large subunit